MAYYISSFVHLAHLPNAAMHLSNVFALFTDFAKHFSSCIYDYEEEEEFLTAWKKMLEIFDLQNNQWLQRMFSIREKCALVYGRQSFRANLITTQQSESMHSVLKKYVSNKHNLLQFFHHFDRLIDDRRYDELKVDLRASHTTPATSFPVAILKHAASVYTHEFTTRGALTTETFQIAKNRIVKLLEEIDESLENVTVTTSTRGTKNIVEKKSSNEAGNTSKEMLIRGRKIKEKKFGKSGKRSISGLEKSIRTKLSQSNVSSSNDAVAHIKTYDRNFNNGEKGISFPDVVESSSSPTLSQLSQVDKSSSSTVYPVERPLLLHMEPFQFAQVFNPVVQQQVNLSHYSREDGQSKMSLT